MFIIKRALFDRFGADTWKESSAVIKGHCVYIPGSNRSAFYTFGYFGARSMLSVSWNYNGSPRIDSIELSNVTIKGSVALMSQDRDIERIAAEAKQVYEDSYPVGSQIRIFWRENSKNSFIEIVIDKTPLSVGRVVVFAISILFGACWIALLGYLLLAAFR